MQTVKPSGHELPLPLARIRDVARDLVVAHQTGADTDDLAAEYTVAIGAAADYLPEHQQAAADLGFCDAEVLLGVVLGEEA